jgi:hypothetical protein
VADAVSETPVNTITDDKDGKPCHFISANWLPQNRGVVAGLEDGSLRVYDPEVRLAV